MADDRPEWRRLYDEAFERFGVIALWSYRPSEDPTPGEARAVARSLRQQGNMSAWRLATRMLRACDAA